MEAVRKPVFRVTYEGRDITNDITRYLLSVEYTDNTADSSDEISISLEDTAGLWKNDWYPSKGDKLKLEIGYDDVLVDCGTFTVDEIELSGPPDTVTIRGLAAGINSPLRSKTSRAYENQTLRQIAQAVADKNGLSVEGEILDITIGRTTQMRETDLAFLKRVAGEYGHLFSVRDSKLVFTSVYDIQRGNPVIEFNRGDLIRYSVKDKALTTYQDAEVSYHNPSENEVVKATIPADDIGTGGGNLLLAGRGASAATGTGAKKSGSADKLRVEVRAENKQQAEAKARAALNKRNVSGQEGSITVEGNPLLVAGNNIELTGLGNLSGKWYVKKSSHRIDKSGGYTTDADLNRVGAASSSAAKTEVRSDDFNEVSSAQQGGKLKPAGRLTGGGTPLLYRAAVGAKPGSGPQKLSGND